MSILATLDAFQVEPLVFASPHLKTSLLKMASIAAHLALLNDLFFAFKRLVTPLIALVTQLLVALV